MSEIENIKVEDIQKDLDPAKQEIENLKEKL